MGCVSGGGEFSSAGGSTKMISDSCLYANGKVLIKRVGENLLPTAQARALWRLSPAIAAPGTETVMSICFGNLVPGETVVAKFQDLLGGGLAGRRTAATHDDAGRRS